MSNEQGAAGSSRRESSRLSESIERSESTYLGLGFRPTPNTAIKWAHNQQK